MIQRIQTVLLFIAFLLDGSVFFNAIYHHAMQDPRGWIGIGFAIILTLAAIGSLGTISLYNKRDKQVSWVGRLMIMQVIALGYAVGIYISLGGFGRFLWDETIGLGLLLLALVMQIYARKKIKDDIELVKSMDRIR